jgi:hypothetical protein
MVSGAAPSLRQRGLMRATVPNGVWTTVAGVGWLVIAIVVNGVMDRIGNGTVNKNVIGNVIGNVGGNVSGNET